MGGGSPTATSVGSGSGGDPGEPGVVGDGGLLAGPGVEADIVAGMGGDQQAQDQRVDDVLVEQEIVVVGDVGEIHVGHPVEQHQADAGDGAGAGEEAGEQRQADQQMAVGDEITQHAGDRLIGHGPVEPVEGLGRAEEAGDREAAEDLVAGGIEKDPRHGEAQEQDERFDGRRVQHGVLLGLRCQEGAPRDGPGFEGGQSERGFGRGGGHKDVRPAGEEADPNIRGRARARRARAGRCRDGEVDPSHSGRQRRVPRRQRRRQQQHRAGGAVGAIWGSIGVGRRDHPVRRCPILHGSVEMLWEQTQHVDRGIMFL